MDRRPKRRVSLSVNSDDDTPAKRLSQGASSSADRFSFTTPQFSAATDSLSPGSRYDVFQSPFYDPNSPPFDDLSAFDYLWDPSLTDDIGGAKAPVLQLRELSNGYSVTARQENDSFHLVGLDSFGLNPGRYMRGLPRHMNRPILAIRASIEEDGSIGLNTKLIHPNFAHWPTFNRQDPEEIARRHRIASTIGTRLQSDPKLKKIAMASFQIGELECSERQSDKDPHWFTNNGTVKGVPFLPQDDHLGDATSRGSQLFQLYYNRHLAETEVPENADFRVARTITENAFECLDDDTLLEYKEHLVTGTSTANAPQMTWVDKWPEKMEEIRGEEPAPTPRIVLRLEDSASGRSRVSATSVQVPPLSHPDQTVAFSQQGPSLRETQSIATSTSSFAPPHKGFASSSNSINSQRPLLDPVISGPSQC